MGGPILPASHRHLYPADFACHSIDLECALVNESLAAPHTLGYADHGIVGWSECGGGCWRCGLRDALSANWCDHQPVRFAVGDFRRSIGWNDIQRCVGFGGYHDHAS